MSIVGLVRYYFIKLDISPNKTVRLFVVVVVIGSPVVAVELGQVRPAAAITLLKCYLAIAKMLFSFVVPRLKNYSRFLLIDFFVEFHLGTSWRLEYLPCAKLCP